MLEKLCQNHYTVTIMVVVRFHIRPAQESKGILSDTLDIHWGKNRFLRRPQIMCEICPEQMLHFLVQIMDNGPARMSVSASVSAQMSVSAFVSRLISW